MRTRSYIHSRSGSRGGVALVAVLVFIVLLTILTVSYISFTGLNRLSNTSYSKAIQAQEVAQGGIQDILSDLHSEIIAGSIKDPGGVYTQNGTTIYIPATNATAMPARIGFVNSSSFYANDTSTTRLPPDVIRVSRATTTGLNGDSFFNQFASPTATSYYTNNIAAVPGGTILNRASSASTTNSFNGGRYISAARWNKTYLLAPYAANVPTPFSTNAPDWVYVTRTGSRVCTTAELATLKPSNNVTTVYAANTPGQNPAASPVVGRYSFVMYDESALLDMNVAGNTIASAYIDNINHTNVVSTPADPTTGMTQTINEKSYEASADLTQLPGGLTTAIINTFVQWRNGSCGSTGNNYLVGLINYAKTGFLNFVNGDSPVLGRQDLINYFASIDTKINTTTATFSKALPYLGTFSRAVSAPVWSPKLNANSSTLGGNNGTPAVYAYHTNAELSNTSPFTATRDNVNPTTSPGPNPNRDLANVRFSNGGTITHYSDDATVVGSTYSVNSGDPLLQGRFSLAKINWLSQANPNTGAAPTGNYPTAIQACFGLVWGSPGSTTTNSNTSTSTANGGNPCWNYVGSPVGPSGTSQAQAGVIETLGQVAQEGREPNFFESLKAAILSGSLGLGPGLAAFNNGADSTSYGYNVPYFLGGAPTTDVLGAANIFSNTFGSASSVPVPMRIPDIQIVQIGANIIDQFDSDSYPTAIYFPYQGVGASDPAGPASVTNNALFGPVTMVYGDENLPVLTKMQEILCSPAPTDPNDSMGNGNASQPSLDDNTRSFEGWLQPEVWNPHQAPGPNSTFGSSSLGTNVPHNFEIRAYGSAATYVEEKAGNAADGWLTPDISSAPAGWSGGTLSAQLASPASANWDVSNSTVQSYWPGASSTEDPTGQPEEAGTITFTDTSATSSLYDRPHLLVIAGDSGSIPGLTNVTSPLPVLANLAENPTDIAQPNFAYWAAPGGTPSVLNHFVAFSAGLISDVNYGSGNYPYYVCSDAQNTNIDGTEIGALGGIDFPVTSTSACTSYALGWLDGSNRFHPYSFITGAFITDQNTLYDDTGHGNDGRVGAVGAAAANIEENCNNWGLIDPRTSRFEIAGNFSGAVPPGNTIFPALFPTPPTSGVSSGDGIPVTGNFTSPYTTSGQLAGMCYPEDWMINRPAVAPQQRVTGGYGDPRSSLPTTTYYADLDKVIRPGDGYYSNVNTGDGMMTYTSAGTGSAAVGDGVTTGNLTGNTQHGRRGVILNRPFRSVGELGYVFRDLPFKTMDFFTQYSADAALLDVFSINDESAVDAAGNKLNSVVAGKFNPSYAAYPVTEAILAAASKKDSDATYNVGTNPGVSSIDPLIISQAIYTNLSSSAGPLLSRADLVVQLAGVIQSWNSTTAPATITYTMKTPSDEQNKAYLEGPVRALSNVTNTRTWNLLIDIIAQSGQMASSAQTLNDFVVQGERRYWLHIAIDRYTGKIVDQQLEPVYE